MDIKPNKFLFTKAIEKKLLENGAINAKHVEKDGNTEDFKPVVKLFGGGAFTWLFSELDADGDTLFGLCDLGQGCAELGSVSLAELKSLRFPPFGLPIERDRWFKADKTLTEYASVASTAGRIVA
jgi:hypothetical protein